MSEVNYHYIQGTDGKHYVFSTMLESIYGLSLFMHLVLYGTELYKTIYWTAAGQCKHTISALGKHAKRLANYGRLYSKDCQFAPAEQFFFEQFRKHRVAKEDFAVSASTAIDAFDDFVQVMRAEAVVLNVKKKINDWNSKFKKNGKRIKKMQTQLFASHGRVVAVRVDLYLHESMFTPAEIDLMLNEIQTKHQQDQASYWNGADISEPVYVKGRVSFEQLQKYRKRLFTNMKSKPSLFKHAIGYVWRIECGYKGGYHLHLMLFFNGDIVKSHQYMAQEVGEYWKEVITDGRGYFNNCNREQSKHRDRWALGEVSHWDTSKRERLSEYLTYFCKTDQIVRVLPYAGCHLFGCGFFHRQRDIKSGRPRTRTANDLAQLAYGSV